MVKGISRSIGIVVLFVVAVWATGELVGFEVELWTTLLASVILTLLLNLAVGGFRRVSQ